MEFLGKVPHLRFSENQDVNLLILWGVVGREPHA